MPIYVYRCSRCDKIFEEIQKISEGAPDTPSDGCPQAQASCPLERQMTSAEHRFKMEYSSDGRGGYERQGSTLIRQVKGKNSSTYGTDKSGRP